MRVFVDSSALFAFLDGNDRCNAQATRIWRKLAAEGTELVAHNYILVEAIALVQRRLGLTAVDDLVRVVMPAVEIHWVDSSLHDMALAATIARRSRQVSLVDSVSFALMRKLDISRAFAFDSDFEHEGFELLRSRP